MDYPSLEEASNIAREVARLKKLEDAWPRRKTGFERRKGGSLKGGMPPKKRMTDAEIAKALATTPGKRDRSSSSGSSTPPTGSPSKKPAAKKLLVENTASQDVEMVTPSREAEEIEEENNNTASQEEEMVTPRREVEPRQPDSSKSLANRLATQNLDDTVQDSPSVLEFAATIATPDAVILATEEQVKLKTNLF